MSPKSLCSLSLKNIFTSYSHEAYANINVTFYRIWLCVLFSERYMNAAHLKNFFTNKDILPTKGIENIVCIL